MAFVSIKPRPGIFRNGTIHQAAGRWCDGNLIRFQQDQVKPVGGWQKRSPTAAAFVGAARALLSWKDNSNSRWIAVGTHRKLYAQTEAGSNADITPLRRNATLGSNPLTSASGSPIVTVHDTGHGASVGDTVTISGAAAFNGLAAGTLNAAFVIAAVVDANTYTVTAGSSASASGPGGGGAAHAAYQITAGREDAAQNLGYGGGPYGSSSYGVPRPNTSAYLAASVWSLDSWGEQLLGCCDTDGKIYLWALDPGTPAALVSGAPTACAGVLATAEGFIFALGAGGDGRKVAWCDQQDATTWTPAATNQAGDYDLTTGGTLQCGRALPSGALLLTDVDAWVATYIGTPLVYGFQRVGSGCGVISKGALASQDSRACWMGRGGFWAFDGQSVTPLDCDVAEHVFSDININQISKTAAVHLADQGEVWWFYPSEASNENDRYVCWAYRESARLGANIWTIGTLARLTGSGRGIFPNPLMVDADGYLYEHETGLNFDGAAAFVETGPLEIGQGDNLAEVQQVIPDQLADGQVNATFYGRLYPNGPETTYGPYPLTSPTEVLFQARQIRTRFTGAGIGDWRIGDMRLDIVKGDAL